MRLLLDTHAFLWWLDGDRRLPSSVRAVISNEENEILVSAASAWEISTKSRLGKLPGAQAVAEDVPGCIAGQGFVALPITVAEAQRAGALPGAHRDPFDRMLAAQSLAQGVPIVTNDPAFEGFAVEIRWTARPAK